MSSTRTDAHVGHPQTAPEHMPGTRKPQRSRRRARWLAPIFILLGTLVMLYPVVATLHNDARQRDIAAGFTLAQQRLGADRVQATFQAATAYNKTLQAKPILDPWLNRVAPDSQLYQSYLRLLHDTDEMGIIRIPRINVMLPIYHGTAPKTLARGVGHLFGSSLPVGGVGTHSVLTGHSALGTATLFDNLPELADGDVIELEVSGRKLWYEVVGKEVVLPTQTDHLGAVAGKDLLTLITCTPYGVNSHRLLVHAQRTQRPLFQEAPLPADATGGFTVFGFPLWMAVMAGVPALGLIAFGVIVARGRRR